MKGKERGIETEVVEWGEKVATEVKGKHRYKSKGCRGRGERDRVRVSKRVTEH